MNPFRSTALITAALLFLASPVLSPAEEKTSDSASVSVFACGPRNAEDEEAWKRYLRLENEIGKADVLVLLGNFVAPGTKKADEAPYAKMAALLTEDNRIPAFAVPGANEWNELESPDEGWVHWKKHFLGLEERFSFDAEVSRQKTRPENFAFAIDGTGFIGINKVGGRVHNEFEWNTRLGRNASWVSSSFARRRFDTKVEVIFAQAAPGGFYELFRKPFEALVRSNLKPALYVHAQDDAWEVQPSEAVHNLTVVQVPCTDAGTPPVLITFSGGGDRPFEFDRRLEDSRWKPQ